MNIIFELKSRKGGARQVEVGKIGQLCKIDYQKEVKRGDKIKCEKVLKHGEEFGQPYLKNRQVIVEVIEPYEKNKKIVVAKRKAKKRYKVKKGHRQPYT